MSREKELAKNTIILSIGKLLPKFMTFITLPILTAQLSKAEYGAYDLISTLIMLVIPIATLQIQSAAFRFLIDCRKDKEASTLIITNIFVVTIPISLLASILVQFWFLDYSVPVRICIAAYLFFDTFFLTLGQIVRGVGKNKVYSSAAIVLSVINMVAIVCTVQFAHAGLFGVLVSLLLANIAGSVYLFFYARVFSFVDPTVISLSKIRELLSYSWPMVPNNLSNWVLKLSDRLVITAVLGVEANAVYAVANKIPNLLSIAQSVLVMAWQENASIAAKDDDAEIYYSNMLDTVFSLMFGCTALLIAGTPIMFAVLIRGDYTEAYYQMPVLILAMFFFVVSSYFGGIYVAHKRTKSVGISTMAAAAINLAIDLVFVRSMGIWAGSLSTLCAYVVLYFYRLIDCQKFQPLKVNILKQGSQIVLMIVMLVFCFCQNMVFNVINFLLGVALFFYFNKNMLLLSLKTLKIKRH